MKNIAAATIVLCMLVWSPDCSSQQNGASNAFLIQPSNKQTTATNVTVEDYSQLLVSFEPRLPPPGKPSKNAWETILKAVGATKESREMSAGMRVKIAGLALPEYSLATFTYDTKLNRIDAVVSAGMLFPRKRLAAGENISFEVFMRDRSQTTYDLNRVVNFAVALIPGSGVVGELSKPYISNLASMSDGILGSLGSGQTSSSYSDSLSPHGHHAKSMNLALKTRDGSNFGTITISLLATPTATREGVPAVGYARNPVLSPAENPNVLAFETNGVSKGYLSDLKAIPQYTSMIRERTDTSISNYCAASDEYLVNRAGLAVIDRAHILYRSMQDAGFLSTDTSSYRRCFDETQIEVLRVSSSNRIRIAPAINVSDELPKAFLSALGCWISSARGDYCKKNAPTPKATLVLALPDTLNTFIDSSYMADPDQRINGAVTKETFIELIEGSAESFSCFKKGMLLTKTNDPNKFKLSGEFSDGKISRIEISRANPDEANCLQA